MFIRTLALAATAAALTATSGLAATVKLDVVDGALRGASNVEVNGMLYDVEFRDGTCVALFSGCDEALDFVFSTADQAAAAAQSLSDTVFMDGPLGNLDSNPALTAGIEASLFFNEGVLLIAFKLDVPTGNRIPAAGFVNGPDPAGGSKDRVSTAFSVAIFGDISESSSIAYARFTSSHIAAVPLPAVRCCC